jgi:hypothetical protein
MITTNSIYNTAKDVVIYLKDGQRKYGILVDDNHQREVYHFISNFNLFGRPVNLDFLEIIPKGLIEAIDTDLK